MTDEELRQELIRFICNEFENSSKAADAWGIGRSFLSRVKSGEKSIPEWMLNKIGYERKIVRIMENEK